MTVSQYEFHSASLTFQAPGGVKLVKTGFFVVIILPSDTLYSPQWFWTKAYTVQTPAPECKWLALNTLVNAALAAIMKGQCSTC